MRLSMFAIAAIVATGAQAFEFETDNPDWALRLDNTFKASTIYRLNDAKPALVDSFRLLVPGVAQSAFPQALNFNAGNDNFRNRGFVSERADWLGEFDAVYRKNVGLHVSAAAWYDAALHRTTDAREPLNGQTPDNEFPSYTRRIAGKYAEVLDAFVFGGWDLGDNRKFTLRAGLYALQWGESLFYGDNGIARAQGPVDIMKLLASPNAQFKEIIRSVPQISAQLQITPEVSIGAYYQLAWRPDRLPPAGSYFSSSNIPWNSSQPEFVGIPSGPLAGNYVLGAGDQQDGRNSGQFGAQLKWRVDAADLGFYVARYNDKGGQLYGNLDVVDPAASNWYYVFPNRITAYGASASRSFGDVNLAGEASIRTNMPLRNQDMLYPGAFAPPPRFATGRTAHANFSWLATFGPSLLARESSFLGEVAWNRVLSSNDPDHQLDQAVTRSATAIQFIFTPTYRQALPGLDLGVPVGIRYFLSGHSSITIWDADRNGSFSVGLDGNYLNAWQFTLTYQKYIGKAVPFIDYAPILTGGVAIYGQGNSLADRSYISLSLRRAF